MDDGDINDIPTPRTADRRSKFASTLRWLCVLPGSALMALVVYVGWKIIARIEVFLSDDNPNGFLHRVWTEALASGLMGAAFVYFGFRIAPANRKYTAYGLTLLWILFSGFLSFPAIAQQDWWALTSAICAAIGSGVVALSVAHGEIDPDTHRLT